MWLSKNGSGIEGRDHGKEIEAIVEDPDHLDVDQDPDPENGVDVVEAGKFDWKL